MAEAVKQPVRVNIYNQSMTLLANDPNEAEALASRVDELMRNIAAHAGNLDTTRAAMLACIHLADELNSAEKQLALYRSEVSSKSTALSRLLDEALV